MLCGAAVWVSDQGIPPVDSDSGCGSSRLRGDPINNVGLTRIGLPPVLPRIPEVWDVFVSLRNYGPARRVAAPLAVQFGGAPIASKVFPLAPNKAEATVVPLQDPKRRGGWKRGSSNRILHP